MHFLTFTTILLPSLLLFIASTCQSTTTLSYQEWNIIHDDYITDLDTHASKGKKFNEIRKCKKYSTKRKKTLEGPIPTHPCWDKNLIEKFSAQYQIKTPAGNDITEPVCRALGKPRPEIIWYKFSKNYFADKKRKHDPPIIVRKNNRTNHGVIEINQEGRQDQIVSKLIIKQAMPSQTGVYVCEAKNYNGSVYAFFDIDIRSTYRPMPPDITMNADDKTLFTGENRSLVCDSEDEVKAHVSGNAHLHWFFKPKNTTEWKSIAYINEVLCKVGNETVCNAKKRSEDKKELGKLYLQSVLELTSVREGMTGIYKCNASNQWGNDTKQVILTVLKKPWLNRTQYVSAIVGCILLLILLVIILLTRVMKSNHMEKVRKQSIFDKRLLPVISEDYLPPIYHSEEPVEPAQEKLLKRLNSELVEIEQKQIAEGNKSILDEFQIPSDPAWEIPRQQIKILDKIDQGFFGQVFRAEITGLMAHQWNQTTLVAVKMLKANPSAKDVSDLFAEIQVLKRVSAPPSRNIINLIGTCIQDGPVFVVLEYATNGNLRDFLRRCRAGMSFRTNNSHSNRNLPVGLLETVPLTRTHLIDFGLQICVGMDYLHKNNVVHRDLAARNVLVTMETDKSGKKNLVLKIADFGLARDVSCQDYYRKCGSAQLPWKWMSLEALTQYVFTTANDVWAFGVVLWEITSLGNCPYPGTDHDNLVEYLKSGARLKQPDHCDNQCYNIMLQTWHEDPARRPNFQSLSNHFKKILKSKPKKDYQDYIDLNSFERTEQPFHQQEETSRTELLPKNNEIKLTQTIV